MDQKKRLLKQDYALVLQNLAKKLGLEGFENRSARQLKKEILRKYSFEEIKSAIGDQDKKIKRKWKISHIFKLLGGVAAIITIATFIVVLCTPSKKDVFSEGKSFAARNVSDPIQRVIIMAKFDEAETLYNKGDKKERIEALGAIGNGKFKEAGEMLKKLKEKEAVLLERITKDNAKTCYLLGNVYLFQAKFKEALNYHQDAANLAPQNAKYKESIPECYTWLGEYDKALTYLKKSLLINTAKYGKKGLHVAENWSDIGAVYSLKGEHKQALRYHKKSLDVRILLHGKSHLKVATCWDNIGIELNALGQYEKARKYHDKALTIRKSNLGDKSIQVAISINNRGLVYNGQKQYEKALKNFQMAKEIFLKDKDDNRHLVAICNVNIGESLHSQESYSLAMEYYRKALDMLIEVFGNKHIYLAECLCNMGVTHRELNQLDNALQCHHRALEIKLKAFENPNPSIAGTWNNLGETYRDSGNYDKALEYFKKALPVFEKSLGNSHQYTLTCRENLESLKARSNRKSN